tara:strand:+ start:8490 stop:8624 length:135 start_codon:yes stop_codon:yes gene_type:complete
VHFIDQLLFHEDILLYVDYGEPHGYTHYGQGIALPNGIGMYQSM